MIDQKITDVLAAAGIDLVLSLPCNMLSGIIDEVNRRQIRHVPVCREEEGIGIAAGAVLAGNRPMLLMQNSGLGNCVNALMSLTALYELPLLMVMSHRGGAGEKISAQMPMGKTVPGLLDAMNIEYMNISSAEALSGLAEHISSRFAQNRIIAILLKRELWHETD